MPPPSATRSHVGGEVGGDDALDLAVIDDERGAIVPALAVEDAGAGEAHAWSYGLGDLLEVRRAVGIEAAAARERFDEARRSETISASASVSGWPVAATGGASPALDFVEVAKARAPCPASRSTISATEASAASRAASARTGKPASTMRAGPCSTSAARVGFGVDAAGFLELERRFLRDGERGAAAEDVERLRARRARRAAASSRSATAVSSAARQMRRARRCSARRRLPVREEGEAGDDRAHEALGRGDALLLAGGKIDGDVGGGGERRVRRVGEREGQRRRCGAPTAPCATMSGLLPDCEMAMAAQSSSFSSRP